MPETAVDQDNCLVFWQEYIGFSRKMGGMKPESEAQLMQYFADMAFRPGVLMPDGPHILRADGFTVNVNHEATGLTGIPVHDPARRKFAVVLAAVSERQPTGYRYRLVLADFARLGNKAFTFRGELSFFSEKAD